LFYLFWPFYQANPTYSVESREIDAVVGISLTKIGSPKPKTEVIWLVGISRPLTLETGCSTV